ncbi:MAG: ABC transporter permease subunit [Vicinamibacteria bacterium]
MATADGIQQLGVRQRVLAAKARVRRVKAVDRLATFVITLGGLAVIVAVCFIFVFILEQTLPLFRSARGEPRGTLALAAVPAPEASGSPGVAELEPLLFGVDEYQMYLYELLPDARLVFFRTADGSVARQYPIAALAGARVSAASRSLTGDFIGIGTADGRVSLQQVRYVPKYEQQKLVDLATEVRDRGLYVVDEAGRGVREVAYAEVDGRKTVAAVCGADEIVVIRSDDEGTEQRATLKTSHGEQVTHVRLGRSDTLVASTANGMLYHWELVPEARLTEATKVSERPITAIEHTLGDMTLIVGDDQGALSGWFRVRQREDDADPRFVRAHEYVGQGSAVRAIGASTRGKTFATAGADGSVAVHHQTSERSLLRFPGSGQAAVSVLLTPKMDGLIAKLADGRLARYDVSVPHPEVSWKSLFGKVWYEGYPQPEYVWQSTGGTDDFETKFSLVPLVFGTIKGTVYALLFAIPLAIMGALYTSQFMHPRLKARVKPTVEIMAALPSVVVGFIAGLWLASRVERDLVPVLLMLALLPAFGTAGILLWDRLPRGFRRALKPGTEIWLILPLLLLGGWVALLAGPAVESAAFAGDFRRWLETALGLVYDQRNSLVVGLAMGFAVIPIIFTISEDAFSSVPQHLSAASLALGASRWQTAVRVVLPTASPGIFSAIMIGFGRAVGETMIVLMATGNTPVLDWSIFNGMRTLSANIAVEIPEAPLGGTLYRTLFLAGLVLFVMTFVVNTAAELVRQRLRDRYKAI